MSSSVDTRGIFKGCLVKNKMQFNTKVIPFKYRR